MDSLVYNGFDFGEFCVAKTVSLAPSVGGAFTCKVKLMLNAGYKMDARASIALRHKLNAALAINPSSLRLPEEPEFEYRGVRVKDASAWTRLFEDGACEIEFEYTDGAAYGAKRVTGDASIDVLGTAETYPVFEFVATEGDSIMVLHHEQEKFINVIYPFAGGELVVMDMERESVTINGVNANTKVGLYSDFFSFGPGANTLTFTGVRTRKTTYIERWL